MKSTHKVEVVPIELKPHPNADSLSIVEVFGYTVCARTEDWQNRSIGAYIPPDSVVDTNPPLGIHVPKYDVDTIRRYKHLFTEGEEVYVTEKIHGANARYMFYDGKMWCGSRTRWKAEGKSIWWAALTNEMEEFCRSNPGDVLYGEVYGKVQDMNYGIDGVKFAAFDILSKGVWVDSYEFFAKCRVADIYTVPVLANIPYSWETIQELAEGNSTIETADHTKEGVVVKPATERYDDHIGRVCLKLVGNGYYSRKDK